MTSVLISLVVMLIIFAVVWWVINYLGLPIIVRKIAVVVFVLILVVWLLRFAGVGGI